MDEKKLIWNEEDRKQILDCKVFKVWESYCKSPEAKVNQNKMQTFTVIEAKDWAIVIPIVESANGKQFVMVWQWRHGAQELRPEGSGAEGTA